MTLRDILLFLFKQKFTIIGVFLLVAGLSTFMSYAQSQVFKAQATVIVERNRAPVMRSTYMPGLDMIEVLNTEAAIVKSRAVMTAVVDDLKPHERPRRPSLSSRIRSGFKNTLVAMGLTSIVPDREKWIEGLLNGVRARPGAGSNVLYIEYQEDDPEWAQKITNAVTDAYIAHHLEVFSSKGLSSFYQRQIEEAEGNLEALRSQLIAYKRSVSVVAPEDAQRAALSELSALRNSLATARTGLVELKTLYAPGHEQIRTQSLRIEEMENLEAQAQNALLKLAEASGVIASLEAEIEAQEKTFRMLRQEFDAALLNERTNPDLVNVRLVDYAALPMRPVNSRLFTIVLSCMAGLVLGLMIAFVRAYFDRRVSTPDELEKILKLPSFGAVEQLPSRA